MNAIERLEREIESVQEYGGIVNQYPEWGERLVSIRISDAGAWLELARAVERYEQGQQVDGSMLAALHRLQEDTP